MTTRRPYRSWCKFCVMGRGVNAPHRRTDAQDDLEGVPHVSMDYGFLGEREGEEQMSLVLVIRERRHKMTWSMLVPSQGTEFPVDRKESGEFFIDQLGHRRVTLRCDNEPAIEALAREIEQARQEGSQTVPERLPVGESQSKGIIERAVGLVAGQARTLKSAPARILCWLVEFAAYLMNRCDIGSGGKKAAAETAWPEGQNAHPGIRRQGPVHAGQASQRGKMGTAISSWSVCGNAELVITGSGRHRARNGDQDTLGKHQEDPGVGEMGRGQDTWNASCSMVSGW